MFLHNNGDRWPSASPWEQGAGAEPHVISTLLGHKNIGGQLTAIYSKSRYRKEHAEALQRLADQIDSIAANVDNIVTLRGSK